jgi:sec-independent protein translocase protein TatA
MNPLFANILGPGQLVVLLILGVLIFGRRLPEIGRYLGKGIVEFKKGMKGLEDDLDLSASNSLTHTAQAPQQQQAPEIRTPQRVQATAPKFEDNLPNVSTPPHA